MHAKRIVLAGMLFAAGGCGSKSARVEAPQWDPSGMAAAICEKLDQNSDSQLSDAELQGAPGLAFGKPFIDADKDGQLSRDELQSRFAKYKMMRIGLLQKQIRITYKNRPLVGAEVRLVPEFFLEGVVEPAVGETDETGIVQPRAESVQNQADMRPGYYRVEVRSSKVQLPQQFNSATTLGVEVSPLTDDPSTYGVIELVLRDNPRK